MPDQNKDNINERAKNNGGRSDDDLPGYPHYPSSEDITHPKNEMKKVDSNLDEMSKSTPGKISRTETNEPISNSDTSLEDEDELIIVPGTEADVTAEDIENLGPRDGDMDMGDDEILKGRMQQSQDENDLDIPGSELDDANEDIGEEDEENNYYSLGGDRHDDLDEDNQQEP
ncbi:MAG: hypothetical protein ACXWCR_14970 [Flavitalea sp.]